MTIWSLWKSCNTKLKEATDTSLIVVVTQEVHNEDLDHSCTKPQLGMIKCNVDVKKSIMGYNMCF